MTLDEAIKHANEVAEENQAIVDSCDYYGENMAKCEECAKEHRQLATWLKELKQLKEQMNSSDKPNKWIPLIKRPMTEEEREECHNWATIEGAMIFDCPLPEDMQEVLISWGDRVCTDIFRNDEGACYFEGVEIDEVAAWMPLPNAYKESEE